MFITSSGDKLQIARNLVDALTLDSTPSARRSFGFVEVNRKRYEWEATCDCVTAEKALRAAAEREGKRVTFIQYQDA